MLVHLTIVWDPLIEPTSNVDVLVVVEMPGHLPARMMKKMPHMEAGAQDDTSVDPNASDDFQSDQLKKDTYDAYGW